MAFESSDWAFDLCKRRRLVQYSRVSISFTGPKGWIEQRWIVYALLRDSVQHHIEGGQPTPDFAALHAMSAALGGEHVSVSAQKLNAELVRAKAVLSGRPMNDLAISMRTRAVLSLHWPPPERRETALISDWGGSVPLLRDGCNGLDEVFGHLIDELLRITEGAGETDKVDISDL